MEDFLQGLWLSGVGMTATVAICAAVIGLVELIRRVVEGSRRSPAVAGAEPESAAVPLPMIAAAVAAVLEGRPHQIISIRESDSNWARAGREELARTEGVGGRG